MSITASALRIFPFDRDHLPCADQGHVSDHDLLHGDVAKAVGHAQPGDLRGPFDERGQLAPGASRGDFLQRQPARKHQADDHAGELFSQREGADHRDQRDHVDPHVPFDQDGPADLERELRGKQRQHRAPDGITGARIAGDVQSAADDDRGEGDSGKEAGTVAHQPP